MRTFLLACFMALTASVMAQDYSADYKNISALEQDGKFRSALEAADKLFQKAERDGDEDDMLKALAIRATYTFQLEENSAEAALLLFNQELANNRNRPVIAPVLHYLIGQGYYTYAQQNQYRLRNATAVAAAGRPPITAPLEDWNLQQLKDAAEEHLLQSLELAQNQKTPLAQIPAVIGGDKAGYALRPTLFDLLAYPTMNYLANPLLTVGNVVPSNPEQYLVSAADFVALDLGGLDPTAGAARRLKVYQSLLQLHLASRDRALLHADLQRIATVRQWSPEIEAIESSLEKMYDDYAGVPGRGMIRVEIAKLYDRSDDKLGPLPKATALDILSTIKDKDPAVVSAAEQLRRRITQHNLSVTTQQVYPRGKNLLISVNYRNLERIYHKVIKVSDDAVINTYRPTEDQIKAWRKAKAVASKSFRLADNDDYNAHQTETWLPELASGRYVLLTSNDRQFDKNKGSVSASTFQVTDLALISVGDNEAPYYEVVHRTTGALRPGVKVTVFRNRDRREGWKQVTTLTTDANGRFPKPDINRNQVRYLLEEDKDRFMSDGTWMYSYRQEETRRVRPFTPLFTDRAIYRPGQTVHIYGITGEQGPQDMPRLLTNEKRTLTLFDANGQEVDKTDVSSDEFSRFSHSFKLPQGGLTGNYYVNTDGGSVNFKVEEYKRPKFKVELTAPDVAVAGEATEVVGQATLFAGPGLDGASVNYRVFREEVRWFWWGRGGGGQDRELVDSGETTTDDDGSFTVSFTPADNLGNSRTRYRYVVEADVADDTGETHEAETSVALRSSKPVVSLQPDKELLDVTDSLWIRASGTEDDLTITYRLLPVDKPGAALTDRSWAFPDRPVLEIEDYQERFPEYAYENTPAFEQWPAAAPIAQGRLDLKQGKGAFAIDLSGYPAAHYRLEWNYPDGTFGEPSHIKVLDMTRGKLPAGMLYHIDGLQQVVKVDQPITLRVISALPLPSLTYRFGSRRGQFPTTTIANNTATISFLPTEADRGGIGFNYHFLRNGEFYQNSHSFNLGWDNKQLQIDYATFRDKLRPGAPERWTLTVKNADGTPVNAAALASMYDASLDQIYSGGQWQFNPWPRYFGNGADASLFNAGTTYARGLTSQEFSDLPKVPGLPSLDLSPFGWYGRARRIEHKVSAMSAGVRSEREYAAGAPPPPPPAPGAPAAYDAVLAEGEEANIEIRGSRSDATDYYVDGVKVEAPQNDPPPVQIRTNLQETAFWFPELTSNDDGELIISFDSPEALTSWKFRVFAHDKELNTAVSEQTIVTQKELMVLPNVPRFLREGDALELTARVNNLSEQGFVAKATVEFFNPVTNQTIDLGAAAGARNCQAEQRIEAGRGTTFCFPLDIPEGLSEQGMIGYRVIVRGGDFSDGEENIIPILTDRTLITVTQPFYLKRKEKKTVTLPVMAGNNSPSLRHVNYTFQATTNPAWMALKALPYLMEYPYDCTEQITNRFFANQLAYVTVSNKPVLETVFQQWKNDPEALKSELERNASLKNALLTETPWVREAQSEAEQRARIGELFDLKKLAEEQSIALDKLAQRQSDNGSYPWFPGGRDNRYVTQYVLESMGRLKQLNAVSDNQLSTLGAISTSAVLYLDQEVKEQYDRLLERMKDETDWEKDYKPGSTIVHYLYARTMSEAAAPGDEAAKKALDFFAERAAAKWLDYGLYEQALLAATSAKEGTTLHQTIVTSLRERAIRKDEFGMYWKYGRGYRWSNLPIETHCRILEAFQLAGGTQDELDEMRLWLLANKRTNRWPTTKSTAAAVFALLNTGTNWTTDEAPDPIQVSWPGFAGSKKLSTRVRAAQATAEAASGAFSVSVPAGEISNDMAAVKVRNKGNELVWGGVYWQYTELAQEVEAANNGPLTLERELFHRQPTADGMRLVPITEDTPLKAGDRVTVRLILRSDRDLDFVHLKDRRAATFEPIEQLSGYRYTNGLGYYQAPGDLATNFFLDHLPKGTYTLEYDLFTTFSGTFSNGLGRVQCMYAPEFGANSSGARIVVK